MHAYVSRHTYLSICMCICMHMVLVSNGFVCDCGHRRILIREPRTNDYSQGSEMIAPRYCRALVESPGQEYPYFWRLPNLSSLAGWECLKTMGWLYASKSVPRPKNNQPQEAYCKTESCTLGAFQEDAEAEEYTILCFTILFYLVFYLKFPQQPQTALNGPYEFSTNHVAPQLRLGKGGLRSGCVMTQPKRPTFLAGL